MDKLQIFLIGISVFYIHGKVEVEFGHFLKPLLHKAPNVDGTVLENTRIEVQLKCKAQYPIMWVFDADYSQGNENRRERWEWTDRKYNNYITENTYSYIAWISFWYEGRHDGEILRCQAVNDTRDYLNLEMASLKATNYQWKGKEIVKFILHYPQGDKGDEIYSTRQPPFAECRVMFGIMYVKQFGYYAHCWKIPTGEESELPGKIVIQVCRYSASFCSNSLRKLKAYNDTCAIVLKQDSTAINQKNWKKLDERFPATLDCHIDSGGIVVRRAREIFFTAPNLSNVNIHFSWSEINPKDMIWMTKIPERIYYIGENLNTTCKIPKYGFSFDPVVILKLDSNTIFEQRDFMEEDPQRLWNKSIDYNLNFPGKYELHCIGAVWNTSEWARKIAAFEVIESILPHFDTGYENITLYADDVNQRVMCAALGDPIPNVEWIMKTEYGRVHPNGLLVFSKVSRYIEGEYICEASNRFGKKAYKTINIVVKSKPVEQRSEGVPTETIIAITVTVIVLVICLVIFIHFKNIRKFKSLAPNLTSEELDELFHGKKQKNTYVHEGGTNLEYNLQIDSLTYNRAFELSKDQFYIDKQDPLGSGAYGIVYKGTVKKDGKCIPSAFKTVKEEVDISYLKALVTEIKVLMYIGKHPNIVNLIGAWTENIRNREIFAAVELCNFCLLKFLRESKIEFCGCIENTKQITETSIGVEVYCNVRAEQQLLTTYDLIRWSKEIALGLEYMSTKRVIHGDVAARNVLLTEDLRAKICDFGLSRQLIDYNYIKSEKCPLPWRWMAIESLSQMKFSEKSDIWSYGVTLWEIFSHGNIPYPGENWSCEFVKHLESGLRMTSPKYAPNSICQLMQNCWKHEPSNRPTFSEVIRVLEAEQM